MSEPGAWPFSIGETVILITSVAGAIVTVINGVRVKVVGKQQEVIEKKVDTVHELTNSRLSKLEAELAAAREEVKQLTVILRMTESTRMQLAEETARTLAATTAAAVAAAAATMPPTPHPRTGE